MNDIDLDSIFIYPANLPTTVHEAVVPCFSGYTVYINDKLSYEQRQKAFAHALRHIQNHDFDKNDSVQDIESAAHA